MPNQYLPNPPIEEIADDIHFYWFQGKNDIQILSLLKEFHIDPARFGLGLTKFKKFRAQLGLFSTRQQSHTIETIRDDMIELRRIFPNAGLRDMMSHLLTRKKKKVTRAVLTLYFETFEPELKQARMGRRLKRRQFWAAGVNVIWSIDQHDKWKYKFGLCLHVGVDVFSGYILWLRIWWNNSNPILICNYYLDTVASLGYVPLLTQSDPGTENTRVADAQSFLRQRMDRMVENGVQHNWKRDKSNIKAEIEWSQLCRRWTAGFESIMQEGVENRLYDTGNPLQVLLFRWLFIPWLQTELDIHRERVNSFPKRKNKHKLTPAGRPVDIHFRPRHYGDCRDFKVTVPPDAIDAARQTYVPANHPVLKLVPPTFEVEAASIYRDIGEPAITHTNIWDVYNDILEQLEVKIQLGFISFATIKGWGDGVVHDSTEDDRALANAQDAILGEELYDVDRPAPEGFVAVGPEEPMAAEWTDEEEGGAGEGDEWLPADR